MCSGSEAGSYLRLIDSCITQLKMDGVHDDGRAWEELEAASWSKREQLTSL